MSEHNPGEPQFGDESGEHNPGEPEFGGEEGRSSTSPPAGETQDATTPPDNPDVDQDALKEGEEGLEQAGGDH